MQPDFNEGRFIYLFLKKPINPELKVDAYNLSSEPPTRFATITLPRRTCDFHPSELVARADNYFECQKDVVLISSPLACWLGN